MFLLHFFLCHYESVVKLPTFNLLVVVSYPKAETLVIIVGGKAIAEVMEKPDILSFIRIFHFLLIKKYHWPYVTLLFLQWQVVI
jgi:hypothetical protein